MDSTIGTLDTVYHPAQDYLQGYHLLWQDIPVHFSRLLPAENSPYTTSLLYCYNRFGLLCAAFVRHY